MMKINMCEQFGWTEREFLQENTVGFIKQIGVYNTLSKKSAKVQEGYQPAKPTVRVVGGPG